MRHEKQVSFKTLIYQNQVMVYYLIKQKYPWIEVPKDWKGMIRVLMMYKPKLYYYPVKWESPQEGWIKCNTDGACRLNPRQGDIIKEESKELGIKTNIAAEVMSILYRLRLCRSRNLHIIVGIDYLSLKSIIRNDWRISWQFVPEIELIQQLMIAAQSKIMHVFREANQLAYKLANWALD